MNFVSVQLQAPVTFHFASDFLLLPLLYAFAWSENDLTVDTPLNPNKQTMHSLTWSYHYIDSNLLGAVVDYPGHHRCCSDMPS